MPHRDPGPRLPVRRRARRRGAGAVLAALALALGTPEARAQAIDRPADERLELPPIEPTPEPPLEQVLPPLPPPAGPGERLAGGPGVFVESYRIVGSTVFPEEELARTVAPWTRREIRSEDLVSVRNALTRLYLENGYVNSGAVLPDQEFRDGVIELRIVEGSLAEIRIEGNDQFRDRYLRDRIEPGATKPLNVRTLERQLQILQRDPRIVRVAARLAPGDRLGEAVLYVAVEEARRVRFDFGFSNHEPPSIGAYAGDFGGAFQNPAGWGDSLWGEFTASAGLLRGRGRYEIPITRWNTLLSFDARYADSEIVEDPFDDLDIKSTFQSYQIGIMQPLYTSPSTLLRVGVIGDWRRTETELLGASFSFPESGAVDGRSTASILRFVADVLLRDQRQVFAARSQVSWGIDVLGATNNIGSEPDGTFVSWLLQLQWARRFDFLDIETIFRTDLQLSNEPLLTMEQIAVGGYGTVRGYRQNQFVQDQGVISSFEVRLPIWRFPEIGGAVYLAPFVDYGHTWAHHDRPGDREKQLLSAGVGVRWSFARYLHANLYWGQNFTQVDTSGDLQDQGVQFEITGTLF